MANETREKKKRKSADLEGHEAKRSREVNQVATVSTRECTAGKIKRIFMKNFMCHEAMEIMLNPNVNFIVGRNGSGKSAILTALVVGLGARANVTNRGTSIKEFIKKGKNSALIEITLVNEGPMAYKRNVYGDTITVSRSIGSNSSYKIKNWRGELISTKREELDHIISALNIQVDNPISVLNQDVSRTFLVTAGPKEKYELFMKATQLDKIGNNYKQAQIVSQETQQQLNETKQHLSAVKREIEELEKNLQMLESIDGVCAEYDSLQKELHWAIAVSEESKLHRIQTNLEGHTNSMKDYEEGITQRASREKEIENKIKELEKEIQEEEAKVINGLDAYNAAREQYFVGKEAYSAKMREWRSVQSRVKRLEGDITTLCKEIERLKNENGQAENEKCQMKQRIMKSEQELDEVEAMLRTKQTDQMHFEAGKVRLVQEEHSAKIDMDRCENKIWKTKRQLNALKQESGSAVTVFGPNMPRLLKRLQEEYKKGRFTQMPRGPVGAYIKVKDPTWIPAVESYLGASSLSSFCVDNAQDAKILSIVMKEVFGDEGSPEIVCSKFYHKVHDVSRHCTRAPGYSNLLEAMTISDPIVTNCLIDQREVECVLLIPTSDEACKMMSDARRVPPNCKRAFTQQGDAFFPDPNYRSYGGRADLKARFLQVSTIEAIQGLEEELAVAEEELVATAKTYGNIREKLQRTNSELITVNEQISKLRSLQRKLTNTIDSLRDKFEVDDSNSAAVFIAEKEELEKKLELDMIEEKRLDESTVELQKSLEGLETEVKRCRELSHSIDARINPMKKTIDELRNEKQILHLNNQRANLRLEETRHSVQKFIADLEMQQRVTNKVIADAIKQCPRIDTRRSINEINRLSKELKNNIKSMEQHFGSKEEIESELKKKRAKYGDVIKFAVAVENSNDKHLKRLQNRRQFYREMKMCIGMKVQNSFENVLALRKYKGSVRIDHSNRLLELNVNPENDTKRLTNDTRSLSGGERSYSTVAFILALWDCTGLPFYFLDEFDVFMDKVNRRVIMDILLDHTRFHPQNQFAFLTPLDTSNVLAEDYVTIHRLAPPERMECDKES